MHNLCMNMEVPQQCSMYVYVFNQSDVVSMLWVVTLIASLIANGIGHDVKSVR